MEKRVCVRCSKEFTVTDSEARFYKSKGLELPKRCKACREERKKASAKKGIPFIDAILFVTGAVLIVLGVCLFKSGNSTALFGFSGTGAVLLALLALLKYAKMRRVATQLSNAAGKYNYTFRSKAEFKEHYKKHGREVGVKTPDEYLKKANAVIENPKSMKKHEKEDNDLVFFNPATCEIVFLSGDKKIRTYYISDHDYFNRQ